MTIDQIKLYGIVESSTKKNLFKNNLTKTANQLKIINFKH